jgi:hypothetical protein
MKTNSGRQAARDERRRTESEQARQARTKRNQPNEIAQKTVMQRQQKHVHKQDSA